MMSLFEKLQKIAENLQNVYVAGCMDALAELNKKADKEGKWELIQSVEVSEDEISSVVFENISTYKKLRLVAKIKVGSTSGAVTSAPKYINGANFTNAYVSGAISTSKETLYCFQVEKINGKWQGWFGSTTSANQDAIANVKTVLNDKAFGDEYYERGFASLIFKSVTSDIYLPIGTTVELWGVE